MTYQIITDEWIDIVYLDKNTNTIIRKANNDKGSYVHANANTLKINWDKWGNETFTFINNIYYNCKNNFFETKLENNEWNDIGIFNIYENTVIRKYYPTESGTFKFINNDLIINWTNWGNERFYQLNYGKYYSNTAFGNNNKNNIKKHIKNIAIVFPQFHEIPENNDFWGKGFTEWTLLKNIPRIVNGEIIKQPHDDIGYFNLNDYSHRKYMRVLADKYNIHGFCYYHYWFKNKKVMYEPTELMLSDGEPNKPFMFCWANEQWTKKWDGGNNEILLEQDYSDEIGNNDHFKYLLQFFKHKNYIKKHNKPIFIFYRIEEKDITHIKNIINLWNKLAINEGFNGIHFIRFLGPFNNNIVIDDISGYINFEPGYTTQLNYNELCLEDDEKIFTIYDETLYLKKNNDVLNEYKSGLEHYNTINDKERKIRTSKFFIYDGIKLYDKILSSPKIYKEQNRGICVNWNNTPRRNYQNDEYSKYPHYYKNITSEKFGKTFGRLLDKCDNDDFIFISAWNEWNEQAMLEPNNEDGYDYLKQLSNSYMSYYNSPPKKTILNIYHSGGGTGKYMKDLKNIFNEYSFIDYDFEYDTNNMNIDLIHINSVIFNNLKDIYINVLTEKYKDIPKYLTIHDYQWLYPNNPNISKNDFLKNKPEQKDINNFNILLSLCEKIIFPSNNIYNNYYLYTNINEYSNKTYIISHCDKIINHNFLVIPKIYNIINIAFVGYFVEYKGSKIFKNMIINQPHYKNYLIKYHIFGELNDIIDICSDNIILHNSYDDNNIINNLHKNNIHGIVHLSIFEESYCYALTNSINSGIPIFYIDNGCLSERLISIHEKYFKTNFNKFLEYIYENNDIYNFYKLNENIQPNRWYLENY
jgi:hypothetical protein